MAEVVSVESIFVEAGRRGARTRWGPPRIARLDDLPPEQRDLILALVATMRETAPTIETSGAVKRGGSRAAGDLNS
jgi:hypothetical protein